MAFPLLLIIVVACLCIYSIAQRMGLQPAILILVIACGVSFIPGIPSFELSPEAILGIVTPPLLYSAALHFSPFGFVRNLRPILGLGFGLVAATTVVAGVVAHLMLPALGMAAAMTLGAILSPPDTAGTVSHGAEVGLPRRVMDILVGESLINDAAALTFFGLAVTAVVGHEVPIENPVLAFLFSAVVGTLVGVVVGLSAAWARHRLTDPTIASALNLIVPFLAYLIAEHLESSDVFAVVAAGFVVSTSTWFADRKGSDNELYAVRLQEKQIWPVIDMLLESFVFAYIGLQCKTFLLDGPTTEHSRGLIIGIGLVLLVVVILVRFGWIFLLYARAVRHGHATSSSAPVTDAAASEPRRGSVAQTSTTTDESSAHRAKDENAGVQRISWKSAFVGSWAGMRGILTMTAAASIPLVTTTGAAFPERDAIQRIAFIVTVGTILIQGVTLPWIAEALHMDNSAEMAEAAAMRERVAEVCKAAAEEQQALEAEGQSTVFAAQRRAVTDELHEKTISDMVASEAIHQIDLEEAAAVGA